MAGLLVVRKGRVLTPRSRLEYRLERIRRGRVAGTGSGDAVALAALTVRVASLPFVALADLAAWPLLRSTLGRGSWWVVEVRFHGPDAEFVRVAEASSFDEAKTRRAEIADERRGTRSPV